MWAALVCCRQWYTWIRQARAQATHLTLNHLPRLPGHAHALLAQYPCLATLDLSAAWPSTRCRGPHRWLESGIAQSALLPVYPTQALALLPTVLPESLLGGLTVPADAGPIVRALDCPSAPPVESLDLRYCNGVNARDILSLHARQPAIRLQLQVAFPRRLQLACSSLGWQLAGHTMAINDLIDDFGLQDPLALPDPSADAEEAEELLQILEERAQALGGEQWDDIIINVDKRNDVIINGVQYLDLSPIVDEVEDQTDFLMVPVLHAVAGSGRPALLQMILEAGGDPHCPSFCPIKRNSLIFPSEYGDGTALFLAASLRQNFLLRILLDAGASPDTSCPAYWQSPLFAADLWANSLYTDPENCDVDHDLDISQALSGQDELNWFTSTYGTVENYAAALESGCLTAATRDGVFPALVASQEGHASMVSLLHSLGAPVDQADPSGATPLISAAFLGHVSTVEQLLKLGADPTLTQEEGANALFAACQAGEVRCATALLRGGTPLEPVKTGGIYPLHIAACKGHTGIINLLLQLAPEAARIGIGSTCAGGLTPLHLASIHGHASGVLLLLRCNAAAALLNGGSDAGPARKASCGATAPDLAGWYAAQADPHFGGDFGLQWEHPEDEPGTGWEPSGLKPACSRALGDLGLASPPLWMCSCGQTICIPCAK
eukprot:gene8840-1585_t